MSIPREARDGVMRVWIRILEERHPGTTWTPVRSERDEECEHDRDDDQDLDADRERD